jgi:oligopeptide/dipeptide ABC transporter ATP-binding protein
MNTDSLLTIKNLHVGFPTERGELAAVNGVDLRVEEGEAVGIVGESGSGKTVLAQSILRLGEHTTKVNCTGEIRYAGENLLALPLARLSSIRGRRIAMIFQEPLSSLTPVFTVGEQIAETVRQAEECTRSVARHLALELLQAAGIDSATERARQYPHELSGGMRQRVMIAIALACSPELLIADEPTTALDTGTQAQILSLLAQLQKERGMALLLISHDFDVVAEVCTKIKVMYLGQIVEEASAEMLLREPLHPYTQGLLQSIPPLYGERKLTLPSISGQAEYGQSVGCLFAPRCRVALPGCSTSRPELRMVGAGHQVRCRKV